MPAQHQVAVERARHRAGRVLEEPDPLGDLGIARDGDTRRRRRSGHRGTSWPSARRCRRRARAAAAGTASRTCCRRRRARPAACASSRDRRDVDDGERGIGRRLDPHQRGAVVPRRASASRSVRSATPSTRCPRARAPARPAGTCRRTRRREASRGRRARAAAAPRPPPPCRSRTRTRLARLRATRGTPRSAARVGLPLRAYSKPGCSPTASCANVDDRWIGGTTAPVPASGSCPTWMARVSKPVLGHCGVRRAAARNVEHVLAGEHADRVTAVEHQHRGCSARAGRRRRRRARRSPSMGGARLHHVDHRPVEHDRGRGTPCP